MEETHKEKEFGVGFLSSNLPSIDIHNVAHGLKGVKADADG
jgi:hypothetical protein